MAKSKAKKNIVIVNPHLTRALNGFVPIFANDDDFYIVERLTKLSKLLLSVNNTDLRSNNPKKITPKMKDILSFEKGLIDQINRRNMDF